MRTWIAMLLGGLTLAAVVGYTGVGRRVRPSVLAVHVSGAPWQRVSIRSSNFVATKSFSVGDRVELSHIEHGTYTVGVEYADGQSVWTEFFHSDVGARRRIEICYDGDPGTGSVRVVERANGNQVLFEGQTTPDKAKELEPFRLDWP